MDLISDVLSVVRLKGALFLNCDFKGKWCIQSSTQAVLSASLGMENSQIILYHLVTAGECQIKLKDGKKILLTEGDIIFFPQSAEHRMGSDFNHPPMPMDNVLSTIREPDLSLYSNGQGVSCTKLICGWLATDRDLANPLLRALPEYVKLDILHSPSGEWLKSSLEYALSTSISSQSGSQMITAKVAESLFIETLRQYVSELDLNEHSWLSGLSHPHINKALQVMHTKPDFLWTVDKLANQVNVSRSVLADCFTKIIGQSPMKYLTQWRMSLAASYLREGELNIGRIIEKIGYDSESAFSRAFKKEYGLPPAKWRTKHKT